MRLAIDDLPSLSVSRLRAAGLIRPDDKTTVVTFPAPTPAPTPRLPTPRPSPSPSSTSVSPTAAAGPSSSAPAVAAAARFGSTTAPPPASIVSRPKASVTGSRICLVPSAPLMWPLAWPLALRRPKPARTRGSSRICATARLSGAAASPQLCGEPSTSPIGMISVISSRKRRPAATNAPSQTSRRLR